MQSLLVAKLHFKLILNVNVKVLGRVALSASSDSFHLRKQRSVPIPYSKHVTHNFLKTETLTVNIQLYNILKTL